MTQGSLVGLDGAPNEMSRFWFSEVICSKVSLGAPNYLDDEVLPISRLHLFLLFLQKLFAKTPLTAFEEQTSFLKENIET